MSLRTQADNCLRTDRVYGLKLTTVYGHGLWVYGLMSTDMTNEESVYGLTDRVYGLLSSVYGPMRQETI